jgi:hypothetical protein
LSTVRPSILTTPAGVRLLTKPEDVRAAVEPTSAELGPIEAVFAVWATSAYSVARELAAGVLRQLPWPAGAPATTFAVMM